MQVTLFDEAEVGMDTHLGGFINDVFQVLIGSGNFLSPPRYNWHPLPKRFTWADNYITAFGLAHPQTVNVILTNTFPASGLSFSGFENAIFAFHGYPMPWYDETIQTDISAVGWLWSFEREGFGPPAPTNNTVFMQSGGSPWNLVQTTWGVATNYLDGRIQHYHNSLPASLYVVGTSLEGFGQVEPDQLLVGPPGNAYNIVINLFTSLFGVPTVQSLSPQALSADAGAASITNVPAYAWMSVFVPTNAVAMSFDFKLLGDGAADSFVAAINGTNVLSLAATLIETNLLMNSGQIDVSAYAGQTTELFFGIVGGTSTNAQIAVQDILFYTLQTNLVDSVGDGIPDTWRSQYFPNVDPTGMTTNSLSCVTCDADGTGQNNFFKYIAGLDPTNPASVFVLNVASATNQFQAMNLNFTPLALGRTYAPQFNTDLVSGAWLPLPSYSGPVTNGNQVTITDTNPIPPQEFYRIDISLP
jgi:hypothetical protein